MPLSLQDLKDWQTLIAAVLALGGAGWTVFYMQRQIASAEAINEKNRRSSSYAARATLPVALSAVSGYAEKCISVLAGVRHGKSSIEDLPSAPNDILSTLKETIAYADPYHAKKIADLLAHFQVQQSRLEIRGLRSHRFSVNIDDRIYDAAELYALAADLYGYARRESEEGRRVRASREEILGALRNMNVEEADFGHLFTRIRAMPE